MNLEWSLLTVIEGFSKPLLLRDWITVKRFICVRPKTRNRWPPASRGFYDQFRIAFLLFLLFHSAATAD